MKQAEIDALELPPAMAHFEAQAKKLGLDPVRFEAIRGIAVRAEKWRDEEKMTGRLQVVLDETGRLTLNTSLIPFEEAGQAAHQVRSLAYALAFCPVCAQRIVFAHDWCVKKNAESEHGDSNAEVAA